MNTKEKPYVQELLKGCLQSDRKAQRLFYEHFGPVMKMVCLRYLFEKQLAEEILNKGFLKVFTKLDTYKDEGSLEGWIRKIMVNECLNENQKRKIHYEPDEVAESRFRQQVPEVESSHELKHLMAIIEALPDGYRMVFNLIEIEGYTHKEASTKLGTTESNSRSQLARAKKLLREKLKNINNL